MRILILFIVTITLFVSCSKKAEIAQKEERKTPKEERIIKEKSPQKEINMPDPEITFDLDEGVLDSLLKASSVLSLPDMQLSSDGTTVVLTVKDKKNATSNIFSKTVAQGNGSTYEMYLRMENIKVIPGDYTVFVSSKGIAQFTNRKQAVEYFIALEPDSTYNES